MTVCFNGTTLPGDTDIVYMEWTDEVIRSPYGRGEPSIAAASELGAGLRELTEESWIEFYELLTPEKAAELDRTVGRVARRVAPWSPPTVAIRRSRPGRTEPEWPAVCFSSRLRWALVDVVGGGFLFGLPPPVTYLGHRTDPAGGPGTQAVGKG